MKKMKSVVIVLLVGVLFLCPIYASADAGEKITERVYPEVYLDDSMDIERSISTISAKFTRESSTLGEGRVNAYATGKADYIKVTVTLQQAASGSSSYSNSSQDPLTKTVYDTNYITKAFSFTVTNNKNYRVKIVVKDKINGVISTRTFYKKMT